MIEQKMMPDMLVLTCQLLARPSVVVLKRGALRQYTP